MFFTGDFFKTPIESLKGMSAPRAILLKKELKIFTIGELLQHIPFRYEDRSLFFSITEIKNDNQQFIQLRGRLKHWEEVGEGHKRRLTALFSDGTGIAELVWFQGIDWVKKRFIKEGKYLVYGKSSFFNGKLQISHPEIELWNPDIHAQMGLQPVYPLTEILRKRYIDSKIISNYQKNALEISLNHIPENLPEELLKKYKLLAKYEAIYSLHLPASEAHLHQAKRRLKFEELFFNQIQLLQQKQVRQEFFSGQVFDNEEIVKIFLENHLPFRLTGAQKRVLNELFSDMKNGKQMNRLLQGDVGSGKTIVAFIAMLLVLGSQAQVSLMAPTEILAEQHYISWSELSNLIGIKGAKLTGSTPKKERKKILEGLQNNDIQWIVGTHALIETDVQFKNLGLCVIDEQHRFGVEQRAKLWRKTQTNLYPHILVMTATPIPRTLAMTLYGDLEISAIDELPEGRKPIRTFHRYNSARLTVFQFIREELKKGRQIYIVYPLIEESEKMDYQNLTDGFESVSRAFPEIHIGMVHGKMKPTDKDFEMQRFIKKETSILVATTVIEVGINVPNASVMVIESAERFGLSQLHQLRGRVGRSSEQSFCILMTDVKLSSTSRTRLNTMCETNDGFEIAEVDLQLRGPGDLSGKQQSGVVNLIVSDLAKDGAILKVANQEAREILENDCDFKQFSHQGIAKHLKEIKINQTDWTGVS